MHVAERNIDEPSSGKTGTEATILNPLLTEFSVRKPNTLACDPDGIVNKACNGMRSSINFPSRSLAASDEMIFLSIRSVFGLHYAKIAAKGMGLEVTEALLMKRYENQ